MPKDIEAPYFPFYPDDFVSDGKVEAMTTEEIGAYLLLLCKAWREKPAATVPNDDRILSRWTRLGDRWMECKAAVLSPWKLLKGDLRYMQPRLKSEYEKMLIRRRQSQQSATYAATKRWEKRKKMPGACVTHARRINSALRPDASSIASSSSISIPSSEGGNAPPSGGNGRHPPEPQIPDPPGGEMLDDRLGGGKSPVTEAHRQAAVQAMDHWSGLRPPVGRGHGLSEINNEHRQLFDLLEVLAQEPPIVRGGEQIAQHLLVPQAVEFLKNKSKPFKSAKFAIGCVRGELADWSRAGAPGHDGAGFVGTGPGGGLDPVTLVKRVLAKQRAERKQP